MDEFDKLIRDNSPESQHLTRSLRELILSLVPEAEPKIYTGWGVIDFQLGGKRDFLSIGPQKKYVNLYFMKGVELSDPQGLLEGTGKILRHVKIRTEKDLQNKALHALILRAAKL